MAEKRNVAVAENKGFAVQDLILVAVLIAAGAVLKLTVSSFLTFAGMKPNFMIAMYCLAIILTKPKLYRDCGGIVGPNSSYAASPKSLRYCMGLL